MSRWTDQWRDFVRETSYVHNLTEEKISNDQFWRSYGIYDQVLMHSGYPGEILSQNLLLYFSRSDISGHWSRNRGLCHSSFQENFPNHCRRSIGISIADLIGESPARGLDKHFHY